MVQLREFIMWGDIEISSCIRTGAQSNRVQAHQGTFKQRWTKAKNPFQPGPTLTLTMASFSPKYAGTHLSPSAVADSRRSALFPTNMIGILSLAASYHKEKEKYVHTSNTGQMRSMTTAVVVPKSPCVPHNVLILSLNPYISKKS